MISQSLVKTALVSSPSKRHQIAQILSPPPPSDKIFNKISRTTNKKQDNVTSTQTGFLIQPMGASLNFFFGPHQPSPTKIPNRIS